MKKYLIIVDIQNDFTQEEGSLFVKGSDKAITAINEIINNNNFYDKIIATQDWHSRNHISFAETHNKKPFVDTIETSYGIQALWPNHCVQGTWGSDLDPRLNSDKIDIILRKGTKENLDSYSAFIENDKKTSTELEFLFKHMPEFQIDICGVATDVCVYNTVKDCKAIFPEAKIRLFLPGCAAVFPEKLENILEELSKLNIILVK